LESAVPQGAEILLGDNASSDGTQTVITEFTCGRPRGLQQTSDTDPDLPPVPQAAARHHPLDLLELRDRRVDQGLPLRRAAHGERRIAAGD